MIMCTLFSMVYGYLNHVDLLMSHVHVLMKLPHWLMCTYVVLWILSSAQLANTCLKLTRKKLINLLNVFKIKSKYSMASFRCIYCWLWPKAAYQHSVSTFNLKEAFVSNLSLFQLEISYEYLTILQL